MLSDLQKRLGYTFRDISLLEMALTHPSYGSDNHKPDNQRLEFLGDAVLELAVSRRLYAVFVDMPEGGLSRLRSALVREESLAAAAEKYKLGSEILLSTGEIRTGGRHKPSLLADAMEAVFAAVYLDGGTEAAFGLVERTIDVTANVNVYAMDAKTRLQELLQKDGHIPEYEIIDVQGPPHAPVFRARVTSEGIILGEGSGHSKRQAHQAAAEIAVEKLGNTSMNEGTKSCD